MVNHFITAAIITRKHAQNKQEEEKIFFIIFIRLFLIRFFF